MSPTTALTSTKKKLGAFKARTCPTLSFNPLSIPPIVIIVAFVILGTAYNSLILVLSAESGEHIGMFLKMPFVGFYFLVSFVSVCYGCESKGRRRVLGFWVGEKQTQAYFLVSALIYLVSVCTMVGIVSGGDDASRTGHNTFPWLTTLFPGGVSMMIVVWIARSEPEEYVALDDEDGGEAGLPAYSSLVETRDSGSDSEDEDRTT